MIMLLGSAYVLGALVDDACMAWAHTPASPSEPTGPAKSIALPTLTATTRSQAAVLISGLLRIRARADRADAGSRAVRRGPDRSAAPLGAVADRLVGRRGEAAAGGVAAVA